MITSLQKYVYTRDEILVASLQSYIYIYKCMCIAVIHIYVRKWRFMAKSVNNALSKTDFFLAFSQTIETGGLLQNIQTL